MKVNINLVSAVLRSLTTVAVKSLAVGSSFQQQQVKARRAEVDATFVTFREELGKAVVNKQAAVEANIEIKNAADRRRDALFQAENDRIDEACRIADEMRRHIQAELDVLGEGIV